MSSTRESVSPSADRAPGAAGETARDVPTARLDSLTGLRFLAAAAVFFYHAGMSGNSLVRAVTGLWFDGVSLFFVLSGFVLTWSHAARPVRASRFWRNRFARVWPLHALVWVFVVGAGLAPFGTNGLRQLFSLPSLAGLGLVQSWIPIDKVYIGGNGPSWSLSCEAFFYLLFPLLIPVVQAVVRRGWWRQALATLLVVVIVWDVGAFLALRTYEALWVGQFFPPARLAEFASGALVAQAMLSGWRPRFRPGQALAALAAIWLFLCVTGWAGRQDAGSLVSTALLLPPVIALIAALAGAEADGPGRGGLLTRRPVVAAGEWSFAFYLIHGWVLHRFDQGLASVPATAAALAVSLLLAWFAHTRIERPLERWIRGRGRLSYDRHQAARPPESCSARAQR